MRIGELTKRTDSNRVEIAREASSLHSNTPDLRLQGHMVSHESLGVKHIKRGSADSAVLGNTPIR